MLIVEWLKVPSIECKGLCVDSCGPIIMSGLEADRIDKENGRTITYDPDTLKCSELADGRCGIYDDRPLICRMWGVAEEMPCVFGCVPERTLSREEGRALLESLNVRSDGRTVATEPEMNR